MKFLCYSWFAKNTLAIMDNSCFCTAEALKSKWYITKITHFSFWIILVSLHSCFLPNVADNKVSDWGSCGASSSMFLSRKALDGMNMTSAGFTIVLRCYNGFLRIMRCNFKFEGVLFRSDSRHNDRVDSLWECATKQAVMTVVQWHKIKLLGGLCSGPK